GSERRPRRRAGPPRAPRASARGAPRAPRRFAPIHGARAASPPDLPATRRAAAPGVRPSAARAAGGSRAGGFHRRERRIIDRDRVALTKLLLERRLPLLDELLHERHPNRALGLRERPRTRLGAAAHAHDVEFALVLHHLGKHVLLRIDLEHGFAKRLGNAWIRPAGVTGRADDAEIPGELDGQRAELLRGLRPRALADELAPVGHAHRARLFEQRHGFGARSDRDVRNAAPLRLVEVGPVLLVVLANVGLWQVVRARDVLPDLLEQLVPQGLAEPLFGLRQLVEAAPARFLGQELDVDHLLEEQAPSLGRLVAKPLERIHALERRDVVTER